MISPLFITLLLSMPGLETRTPYDHNGLIMLDIVAQDSSGSPVTDLHAEDFTVKVDGHKVAIKAFEVLNFGSAGVPPKHKKENRVIMILLDFFAARPHQIEATFDELDRFLIELGKGSGYHVLIFSMELGPINPPTTTDPASVRSFLTQFREEFSFTRGEHDQFVDAFAMRTLQDELNRCLDYAVQGTLKSRDLSEFRTCIELTHGQFARLHEKRTAQMLTALEGVFLALDPIAEPKFLFLFSPGLSPYPGRVASEMSRAFWASMEDRKSGQFWRPSIESSDAVQTKSGSGTASSSRQSGTGGPVGAPRRESPHLRFYQTSLMEDYRRIAHLATTERVTLSTISLPGASMGDVIPDLTISDFSPGPGDMKVFYHLQEIEQNAGLRTLAEMTGGFFIEENYLDRVQGMVDTLERTRVVYVLGVGPRALRRHKFQKISVASKRGHTRLIHASGYYSQFKVKASER